jgi:phospholipid-transporting ATPase
MTIFQFSAVVTEGSYDLNSLLSFSPISSSPDTTVIPLLNSDHPGKLEATLDHMNLYAREGLRTLIIASKEISDYDYLEWEKIFAEAQ